MEMNNLDPNELAENEKGLIAPCGIYCGACDLLLGNSRNLAKELYRILNGFNMADIGALAMGIERERVADFLNILQNWSQGKKCLGCVPGGCFPGGGIPSCPVRDCSQQRGFLTCAECDSMPCNRSEEKPSPEAAAFFGLVIKRYSNWNIGNLERIRKVGYRRFVDEMQEKVRNGFLTSDVISREMVVSKVTENRKKKADKGGTR
jgi:hypothetical protein